MKRTTWIQKTLSVILVMALIFGCVPVLRTRAAAKLSPSVVAGTVTDPGTADSWEHMMGTDIDGNRYAGRMWVDKSVYQAGDTVVLNSRGEDSSSFRVTLEEDEAFQVVFSALGSTMTTKSTVSTTGPVDVVLVLDVSTSMDDVISGSTRLEKLIKASNKLLGDLLTMQDVRIGIVAYNEDAIEVLPFAPYENGVTLKVLGDKYSYSENDRENKGGIIQAFDKDGKLLHNNTSGYSRGTNVQAGVNKGLGMLEQATDTQGRTPVAIVLTDGAANAAVYNSFYNITDSASTGSDTAGVILGTLLNAAYKRAKIEKNYGKIPMVYGVGVDIGTGATANAVINPGDENSGFSSKNTNRDVQSAYNLYTKWLTGQTVQTSGYSQRFTFDHGYTGVTLEELKNNIHYVDVYYPVSSTELELTFDQIYEELSSGVFNPISTSTVDKGGTGVDDTPLIYVDFIGQHMEIKKIQSVTLFGASYGVVKNADGSYTVTETTGTNPTTGEIWNTAQDIRIDILTQADGTQKLEIRINQEILPIILEQVATETVGDVTTASIHEFLQDPLRVYYTVGIDNDILLPNGEVDVSKLQGYGFIDDAAGTVSFYSGQFGVMNPAEADGAVRKGDAHVGFRPSLQNRYYYHQTNQGIFTRITDSAGNTVSVPENDEYGILWNGSDYSLDWMTYEEYLAVQPEDKVYTYVTYYRPTVATNDAPNAAEEVTYLVYTDWKYLRSSVAFYDATAGVYLQEGKAVEPEMVQSVVEAYRQANPGARIYAVLGTGSMRTSRLHNMVVEKTKNNTLTAVESFTPEYTLQASTQHYDNDVVIWLGNNGRLTVEIKTGIALMKAVTEAIGDPDDTYALTVTVPAGVAAEPVAVDEEGKTVPGTYSENVFTVRLKAGQTVYITGIPGGTQCTVDEVVEGDYYILSKTDTVTVPLLSQVLSGSAQYAPAVVTNAPHKSGSLYITKEIVSDHAVPGNVLNTPFNITVFIGAQLAGQTFTVRDSFSSEPYTATADGSGVLHFTIRARQTLEILDLPGGTPVLVTEATPDHYFSIEYRTRDHSGEEADSDNALVIPAGGSATAVVLNHYTPTATVADLDIVIEKNFADASVAELLEGGSFRFRLEKYVEGDWLLIDERTIYYGEKEYGLQTVVMEDVLQGQYYTKVGTESYRVLEVKGEDANVTYDRTVYTFDVVVTDSGGQLVAQLIGIDNTPLENTRGDEAIDYITTFVNTYDTAPVSMDIRKEVVNRSGDDTVSAAGFCFRSLAVDAEGNPLEGAVNHAIYSDAAGEARISGVYTREQLGTHYYIIYEEAGGGPGWTDSQAQYFVTVLVEEDDNGKLFATMTIAPYNDAARGEPASVVTDGNKGQITFTNIYDPQDVILDLDSSVKKVLTGKELEDGQFTFHVYKDGQRDTPVLTGTNKQNGDVVFVDFEEALILDRAGKYQFDIVEYIPTGAVWNAATGKYILSGMHYDATVYDLVVEVTNDPETGKLVASHYFEDASSDVVTFYNEYEAVPARYALGGNKLLSGRAPRNGEFFFGLYEGETLLETVSNKADGSFTFSAISYTETGTYTYTIREKTGSVPGVTYGGVEKPVTVTVTVTDIGGELQAEASLANGQIRFVNTYQAAAARVTFNGTKVLQGGVAEDGAFTFALYATDNSFRIDGASPVATAQNAEGVFAFTRSFATPGTYYFVIAENADTPVENVVYDRTHHKFTVLVSDSGNGQLRATVTNMDTGDTAAGASVSTAVTFTNALFEEVTEKSVYKAENVTTSIDGQKVDAGDILTYFITYTNYTGENVVVDIMDTIPAHTAYVEGSAAEGGTYAGTHLNWILRVEKGESVTVSFRVQVLETEAIVANTAVVRDGVNTYHTNQVVNHTLENILDKDVFAPADPETSIDGQQVRAGDTLLYKITFTNTGGKTANVTITDRIPGHTVYIPGSADNGGVFENGTITWTLENLPAWETVTVSFRVQVAEDAGAVTIENQAVADDGTNRYESRRVTNTVEAPPAATPETGDNTRLQLWTVMLLVSGTGLVVIGFRGKKEEEES